jgi:hypothetical protein
MPEIQEETRRVNRFYIYTGPARLLAVATADELRAALKRMRERRHVNVNIVAEEIRGRESGNPRYGLLTVAELQFLEHGAIGESMDRYLRRIGVTRRYDYVVAPPALPTGVRRRPQEHHA